MDPMEAPSSPHNTDDANQNGNDTTANTSTSPEEARLMLEKTQEELKLAISVGNIGIWQWDAKSNVVKWSNEQAALYGVEAGEYPNGFEKWLSHVHPDDVARMRNELVSDEQKDYYHYEFRIRHADGSTRWLRARSRVFYDADSQPEYVVGVNFDVTKEKEDDQALLYQKQLLETVTNNTTLALFLMDGRQHCVYMNEAAEQMTGFTLEELQGKQLHYFIHHTHPDGRPYPLEECPIDQALPAHKQMQGEEVFVHRNGSFFPVTFTASPIIIDGKATGTVIEVRNTAEEKKREQALRESNERFQLINKATQDAIWDWDLQANTLLWNEALYSMFGYEAAAVDQTIDWWYRHIHPDDQKRVVQGVNQVIENGGDSWVDEYQFLCKDGSYKAVYDRAFVLYDTAGKAIRMLGSMQDITERKQFETTLKESEERFRSFADNITNLAWIADGEGWIYWYNQRWYNYTGTTLDEMQGWGWEKVHHPDHIGHVMAFVKEAWKRDEPFELTFPLRRHDGVYRWFLTRAVPVKNEAGTIYRWIGTNTDIHEQKMAEERFRTLAETLPQLVWMTDAAGTYEYASHHWQEYSGIDPRSENAWVKIVHPEDLGPLTEVWLRCLATGETYRADVRLINKEGEYRWHFVRGEPVRDEQGKIMKWIGAFTDNHEQRTMTEKLEGLVTQRTKELQRSNEDLQQFAHVASHDLKEPLRKIRTFGSRLNHEFGDTLPEQAKVYLAKIEAAAARMYAMIDGVLNYSTLNITDQIVERVDLNEVMRNIEADLEVVIQQKNAVIEYGHLPALEGSAVLLNQLFYNLVYNSLKFSNTHITPKILITAAPLSGTAAARDWNLDVQATYVQLTVQDNGIGFSQDQAERIFKTFTRLNAKDKYEGTGLGLALCKKIAERHNGAISAAGMEGMGAIFKVVLPLQQTRKTD